MQRTFLHTNTARFRLAAALGLFWAAGGLAAGRIRVLPTAAGDRIRLVYTPPLVQLVNRTVDGQVCTVVRSQADGQLKKRGYPELPFVQGRIALPGEGRAALVIRRVVSHWVSVPPPRPSAGFVSRTGPRPQRRFGAFYSGGGTFPRQPATLRAVRRVHGARIALVTFFPCQYDAGRQALRICTRIEIDLQWTGTGSVAGRRHRARSRMFSRMLRGQVLNPETVVSTSGEQAGGRASTRALTEDGSLLIVAPAAYQAALADFVLWKRQRGLRVELATYPDDTGSGDGAVQDFFQAKYDSENLDFIILVGDAPDIPYHTSTTGIPSDTLYTRLDGDDYFHDVLISRISANSADDVANQAAKFVLYERNPGASGSGDWVARGTCIASNQGASSSAFGKNDYEILTQESTKWTDYGYTQVDHLFDPGVTATDISDALDAGRGLVYYLGHGSDTAWNTGNFDVPHAEALTNGTKLPFIVVGACHIGDFTLTSGDCLAEAFMKAGSAASPAGAVGIIGATTAMDWDPPIVMLEAFSAYLTGQTGFTPGEMPDGTSISVDATVTTAGALAFLSIQRAMDWCDATPDEGATAAQKIMEQTHLFGDCTLGLRTRAPGTLAVTHPNVVVPLENVTVTVTFGGASVPDAVVCFYRPNDVQVSAITDPTGAATLRANPAPGDPLTLTVFHPEYVPFQTQVPVGGGELRIYSGAAWPDAFVGEDYAFTVLAAGGTPPYSWSIKTPATAPAWLSLAPETGAVGGTPDAPGTYTFTVQVSDSATRTTAEQAVTLTAGRQVQLLNAGSLAGGTVLAAYDQAVPVEGDFPPFTFSLAAGEVPPGLALSAGGSLRGLPEVAGTYTFTAHVADAHDRTDEAVYQITVQPADTIAITTQELAVADLGKAYQQVLAAEGGTGKGFTWVLASGSLPNGLALDRSGVISGVPEIGGTFDLGVRVQDDAQPPHEAVKDFQLAVKEPVHFTGTELPAAYVGIPYAAQVPVTGSYTPIVCTASDTAGFITSEETNSFGTGGEKQPWLEDEHEWTLNLNFGFPFYGQTYTSVRVGDNGYLVPGTNPSPVTLWDASGDNLRGKVMIAPFWNDLIISPLHSETGIFVTQTADSATIRWRGREYDHQTDPAWDLNFSVALHADGTIRFRYGDVRTTNRVAIGVSDGAGDAKIVYEQDKYYPNSPPNGDDFWSNHADVVFTRMEPIPPWLTLTADGSLSGTPPAAGTASFTVQAQDKAGNTALQVLTMVILPVAFTLDPVAGWNCISLPIEPTDPSIAHVFPGATQDVWEWNAAEKRFMAATQVHAMQGYWVLYTHDPDPIPIDGTAPADPGVDGFPGWNFVGPVGARGLPSLPGLQPPAWTRENGQYIPVEQLAPGRAYWLFLGTAGRIDLGPE